MHRTVLADTYSLTGGPLCQPDELMRQPHPEGWLQAGLTTNASRGDVTLPCICAGLSGSVGVA